jgi:hypothetical protein
MSVVECQLEALKKAGQQKVCSTRGSMGFEARHNNGKLYYYKKRREGDRVISEYVSSGELAEIIDLTTRLEQNRKQEIRAGIQAQQMSMDRINSIVDSHSEAVDRIVELHLLALGYHKHKRQWRRKRG